MKKQNVINGYLSSGRAPSGKIHFFALVFYLKKPIRFILRSDFRIKFQIDEFLNGFGVHHMNELLIAMSDNTAMLRKFIFRTDLFFRTKSLVGYHLVDFLDTYI